MGIKLSGLASGIDTESLITQLVQIARAPIDDLTKKQANISGASQTISSLSSKLSVLKNAALALSTNVGFNSSSATSSDSAVVTSVTGSASPGSYTVQVEKLAREQRTRSDVQSSSTTALGLTGTIDITVGSGETKTIDVSSTNTLTDIATKISSSGARASASIMFDGTGYRLLVRGLDTGTENAITFDEQGLSLGLTNPANTYQSAQNASLTVDGMTVTSKTNQVTAVVPGVTLALTKSTTSDVTINVGTDSASLKQKINAFVNAYNDIVNTGHNATGYAGSRASNPELSGDTAIRSVLNSLGAIVGAAVTGTSGTYQSVGSVGLKTKGDGTLTFDASAFDKAMSSDPSSVAKLFVKDSSTGSTGIMTSFMSAVDKLTLGKTSTLQARISSLSSRTSQLTKSKTKLETRVSSYEQQLRAQFAQLDQLVTQSNGMASALSALSRNNTG